MHYGEDNNDDMKTKYSTRGVPPTIPVDPPWPPLPPETPTPPAIDVPFICARGLNKQATKRRIRIVQYGKVWYVEMRQSGNDTYRSVNGTTKARAMEKARNLVVVTGGMLAET